MSVFLSLFLFKKQSRIKSARLPKVRAGSQAWDLCSHTRRVLALIRTHIWPYAFLPLTWCFEEQVYIFIRPRTSHLGSLSCPGLPLLILRVVEQRFNLSPPPPPWPSFLQHIHSSSPLFPSVTLILFLQRNCMHLLFDSLSSSMSAGLRFLLCIMPSTVPGTWPVLHRYVLNKWVNSSQEHWEQNILNI